jgi:uncharacterized membrane protein
MDELTSLPNEQSTLEINNESILQLKQTRKWTALLSILGFVFLTVIVLISVVALVNMRGAAENQKQLLTVVPLILMGVIYFFPIYYLWKFSKHSKKSIALNDTSELTLSLKYLKSHYKFMAILILVIVIGYLVAGAIFMSGKFGNSAVDISIH